MDKITLTQRNYLGEGYYDEFQSTQTGEIEYEETTKEQYESMGGFDGHKNNPESDMEWTWIGSIGGTIKVDNVTGLLQEGEGTILPDGTYVVVDKTVLGNLVYLSEDEFNSKYLWQ